MTHRRSLWTLAVAVAVLVAGAALRAGASRDSLDVTFTGTGEDGILQSAPASAPVVSTFPQPGPAAASTAPAISAAPAAVVAPAPASPAPATAAAAQAVAPSSATTVPSGDTRPAPAAAVRAGTDSGESVSPGRYHETPDSGNYVVRPAMPAGSAGSALSVGSGPERLRFDVSVADDGDTGRFTARLVNMSGRTMRFEGGVHVVAEVTLDGRPWRTFDLVDGATTELAPGAQVSLATSFPFDQPGQYSSWGSTDVEIV